MSLNGFVERMDWQYHRGHLPLIGWVFCDWWDIRVTGEHRMVIRERLGRLVRWL